MRRVTAYVPARIRNVPLVHTFPRHACTHLDGIAAARTRLKQTKRKVSFLQPAVSSSGIIKEKFSTNHTCVRTYIEHSAILGIQKTASGIALKLAEDNYSGIHVDVSLSHHRSVVTNEKGDFYFTLQELLGTWQNKGHKAVWLTIPIELSYLIPAAAELGFLFHHAEDDHSVLSLWMEECESRLPRSATHQVGVGGCCVDQKNKRILVVRERGKRRNIWKLPGGHSNPNENFADTAKREVLEETGIKAECESILLFRQHHNFPGSFGKSDLYVVMRMVPYSFEISPCNLEIHDCQWMDIEKLENLPDTTPITRKVVQLVKLGLQNGFDSLDIVPEAKKSVYRGDTYFLYHSCLPK